MMATAPETALRTVDETRMAQEGQANAGGARRIDDNGKPYYDPAPLSDYPRMMYRKTDVEQYQAGPDALSNAADAQTVINRFDGLLCETCIAETATEAEALAELGWDTSPRRAHGLEDGLVAQTSAKDDEIARLRALLEASVAQADDGGLAPSEAPRRGRPPKTQTDA